MSGGINQIEFVFFSPFTGIRKGDGMALDGDPPFLFKVHGVQNLMAKLALADHSRMLDKAIGKGRFAVIDMGDDAEVAYLWHSVLRSSKEVLYIHPFSRGVQMKYVEKIYKVKL
jgi:hypothetical protein